MRGAKTPEFKMEKKLIKASKVRIKTKVIFSKKIDSAKI